MSGRVWRVSGWCLIDSGYCQDCIDGVAIDKNHFLSSYSTTAFPSDTLHNANINRWIDLAVSGRCQEGVWMTLDTAWMVIMPNILLKLQWRNIEYCFDWLIPFISMTLDWPLSVLFWDVLTLRGRCLGGVLGCLSDSGYYLGWGGVGGCMTWNWLT